MWYRRAAAGPVPRAEAWLILPLDPSCVSECAGTDGDRVLRRRRKEDLHLHFRLLAALEIITHDTHYDTQHPAYQDIIRVHTLIHDPYTCQLDSITRPGIYSEFMTLFAASAALYVGLESYCPPANTTEFKPASMTRKVCGRGLSIDATPAVTLMWTTTLVPRTTDPFRPNRLVLLHSRPHAVPVAPTSSQ